MNSRIAAAALKIIRYYQEFGTCPELGSEFVNSLDLTNDDIRLAVESKTIQVVFPAGGPSAALFVSDGC